MNPGARPPSIGKIAWTDYGAFIAILIPIVAWIVFVSLTLTDWVRGDNLHSAQTTFLLGLGLLSTLVGIPIFVYRIRWVRRLFQAGVETRGKIAEVDFMRDRGFVEYNYIFKGKAYVTRNTIHRNRQTRALRKNDRISLLVDPQIPERALIRDLYL